MKMFKGSLLNFSGANYSQRMLHNDQIPNSIQELFPHARITHFQVQTVSSQPHLSIKESTRKPGLNIYHQYISAQYCQIFLCRDFNLITTCITLHITFNRIIFPGRINKLLTCSINIFVGVGGLFTPLLLLRFVNLLQAL